MTSDDRNGFHLSVPSWVDRLAKHGPWVLLAFALVYYQLFLPKPSTHDDVARLTEQIDVNEKLITSVQTTMDEATRMMHDASARRNRHEEAVVQLLTQLCLLQADGPIGRQNCWTAMRGEALTK